MKDFTIDSNVLCYSSDNLNQNCSSCRSFLDRLKNATDGVMVIDDEGLIRQQYSRVVPPMGFGRSWITHMLTRSKYSMVSRSQVPKRTRIRLHEQHMDSEDLKIFVRTCLTTGMKAIVSYDQDYSPRIVQILQKELRIRVLDASAAEGLV